MCDRIALVPSEGPARPASSTPAPAASGPASSPLGPEARSEIADDDLETYVWNRVRLDRGLDYVRTFRWETTASSLDVLVRRRDVVYEEIDVYNHYVVFASGPLAANVRLHMLDSSVVAHIASPLRARGRIAALRRRIERVLPPVRAADDTIPVLFWYASGRGPATRRRNLSCPPWEGIARNYPAPTRASLDRLMREFRPGAGGQMLLWHGAPGTGKTHALRAMAREWREWCRVEYVTDPEAFLGASEYLMRVLVERDDDEDDADDGRWRLIVLEDTGELLSADAKERTGQGLSRLLNVVDGFIGQGLQLLVLVTTNEDLGALHEAVSRPGRCAAAVEFVRFRPEEACEWLDGRSGAAVRRPATLAELFAIAEGRVPEARRRPVGFRPPGT